MMPFRMHEQRAEFVVGRVQHHLSQPFAAIDLANHAARFQVQSIRAAWLRDFFASHPTQQHVLQRIA